MQVLLQKQPAPLPNDIRSGGRGRSRINIEVRSAVVPHTGLT